MLIISQSAAILTISGIAQMIAASLRDLAVDLQIFLFVPFSWRRYILQQIIGLKQ
jgi:hypothetical protein